MTLSNYPNGFANGVNVRGVPVLNSYGGKVFWLDSGGGNDNNRGTFDRPFATIDQALTACTASNGDIIMVKPGHAEDIANATTFVVDKAGVAIVGLGAGDLRPTFTFTATAGSVELDAANCTLQNLRFLASVSAVVVGINVDANGCRIVGCEFDFDATGDDFVIGIDCTDVSGTVIEGNRFIAEIAAGADCAIEIDNSDEIVIVGNYAHGDFAKAVIFGDTTGDTGDGSSISNRILIKNNDLYNGDTSLGIVIDLNSADTGILAYNDLGNALNVAESLDPGACRCFENYAAGAVDVRGGPVPQTADT